MGDLQGADPGGLSRRGGDQVCDAVESTPVCPAAGTEHQSPALDSTGLAAKDEHPAALATHCRVAAKPGELGPRSLSARTSCWITT